MAGYFELRASFCGCFLLILTPMASAQPAIMPMPITSGVDQNGVDMLNWTFSYELGEISLGPPDQDPLKVSLFLPSDRDSFSSNLRIADPTNVNSTRVTATIGPKSWAFLSGSAIDGSATFFYASTEAYVYLRDGTVITYSFPQDIASTVGPVNMCASSIVKPDGETLTYHVEWPFGGPTCRAKSVVSNKGYQIKYEYPNSGTQYRSKITLINNAYEYCNPDASSCSLSYNWPSVTISSTFPITYTTNSGQTWIRTTAGLQSPGQTTPGINWVTQTYMPAYTIGTYDWRVTSVTRDGQTWTYSYPSSDPIVGGGAGEIAIVQDPQGGVRRYRRLPASSGGDPTVGETETPNLLTQFADELGSVETYSYTAQHHLSEVRRAEGNKIVNAYDDNGDLTSQTRLPKPGSTTPVSATTFAYANGCCDKPTSVTDANNNVTDYTYDPVHGGVLTETGPAPSVGSPRPAKRYSYSQHYAWVKNAAGAYVQASSPLWLKDSEKTCRTSATVAGGCASGPSDEVVVTYDYGPAAGPNNLWLRGKIITANGVSLRTCYGYDKVGNKISETSPRAGLTSCP